MRLFFQILLGAVLALVAMEGGLRLLPVSTATHTGYYIHPHILTYPPNHRFTTSSGWDLRNPVQQRANNYGFLTSRDFSPNPQAIALIGDSYVEASMLPESQRLASRLEEKLQGRPVFAFGGPGSNLLDYAQRIAFAHQTFGIRDFVVILERRDIIQAICGSGHIHAHCIDQVSLEPRIVLQEKAGMLKSVARQSALAQYLFSQIKLNFSTLFRFDRPADPAPAASPVLGVELSEPMAKAVLRHFVATLPIAGAIRLNFVIDANRSALFDDKAQQDRALADFSRLMRERGATVIDLAPAFRADSSQKHLSLRISAQDSHWNSHAILLVAEAIRSRLSDADTVQ